MFYYRTTQTAFHITIYNATGVNQQHKLLFHCTKMYFMYTAKRFNQGTQTVGRLSTVDLLVLTS